VICYRVTNSSGELIYIGNDLVEAKMETLLDGSTCVIIANDMPLLEYSPLDGWRGL